MIAVRQVIYTSVLLVQPKASVTLNVGVVYTIF